MDVRSVGHPPWGGFGDFYMVPQGVWLQFKLFEFCIGARRNLGYKPEIG